MQHEAKRSYPSIAFTFFTLSAFSLPQPPVEEK
jgi:hypothetical protein